MSFSSLALGFPHPISVLHFVLHSSSRVALLTQNRRFPRKNKKRKIPVNQGFLEITGVL